MTPADIYGKEDLIEVVYNGFGFVLVKKGVFEKLTYPWFKPEMIHVKGGDYILGEDIIVCRDLREKGVKIYVDPLCVVGHEKTFMI